jgi:hypothetical protein
MHVQPGAALGPDAAPRRALLRHTRVVPVWRDAGVRWPELGADRILSTVRSPAYLWFLHSNSTFSLLSLVVMLLRWLGQNSKQSKLQRSLTDIQIRMRLKVSGDKSEIRQAYVPALFPHVVHPLADSGAVRSAFARSPCTC